VTRHPLSGALRHAIMDVAKAVASDACALLLTTDRPDDVVRAARDLVDMVAR